MYSGFRLTYVKGKIYSLINYSSCRRRGKNKVATQNCRKRKLKEIEELQIQIGRTTGLSLLYRNFVGSTRANRILPSNSNSFEDRQDIMTLY
jgi:hypothetical protein